MLKYVYNTEKIILLEELVEAAVICLTLEETAEQVKENSQDKG